MDKLYSRLAMGLSKANNGTKEDFEIYKFGIQTGIEQGLFFLASIVTSIFLNELTGMLIFLLVFMFVRPYIDGFHLKSYLGCFILSVASSLSIVFLSQNNAYEKNMLLVINIILMIVTYFCLMLQSKKIEKNEFNYYLKKLKRNLFIILLILLSFYMFNNIQGMNVIALTFILIIFSLFMGILKSFFNKKKIRE